MYHLIRKILFRIDPETVHQIVMSKLKAAYSFSLSRRWMKKEFVFHHPKLEKNLWGLNFPNPVGLAAGFDKDAKYPDVLACLGFGFVEMEGHEARAAIAGLNGKFFDGKNLRVSFDDTRGKRKGRRR